MWVLSEELSYPFCLFVWNWYQGWLRYDYVTKPLVHQGAFKVKSFIRHRVSRHPPWGPWTLMAIGFFFLAYLIFPRMRGKTSG